MDELEKIKQEIQDSIARSEELRVAQHEVFMKTMDEFRSALDRARMFDAENVKFYKSSRSN